MSGPGRPGRLRHHRCVWIGDRPGAGGSIVRSATWIDGAFSVDLTSKVNAVGQYRLRFIPRTGTVRGLKNVVLKLHDVPEPNFIKPVKGSVNELLLDITGVAETVQVSGHVEGAASGDILLQKV